MSSNNSNTNRPLFPPGSRPWNKAAGRTNHFEKLNTYQHKKQVLSQLNEMFNSVLDEDVIKSVALNTGWNVSSSIEALMEMAQDVDTSSPSRTRNVPPRSQPYASRSGPNTPSPRPHQNTPRPQTSAASSVATNAPSLQAIKIAYQGYDDSSDDADVLVEEEEEFEIVKNGSKTSKSSSEGNQTSSYRETKVSKQQSPTACEIHKAMTDGVKVMVLMRGLPGSGKSYLAVSTITSALDVDPSSHIFSADDFFSLSGSYVFASDRLKDAHAWNQRRVYATVSQGLSPVFVDNTNTMAWEMEPYAALAVRYGYRIHLLEPDTPWRWKEGELAQRNVHNVAGSHIHVMLDRYERYNSVDQLLARLKLSYTLGNAPPQPCSNRPTLINARCSEANGPRNKKKERARKTSHKSDKSDNGLETEMVSERLAGYEGLPQTQRKTAAELNTRLLLTEVTPLQHDTRPGACDGVSRQVDKAQVNVKTKGDLVAPVNLFIKTDPGSEGNNMTPSSRATSTESRADVIPTPEVDSKREHSRDVGDRRKLERESDEKATYQGVSDASSDGAQDIEDVNVLIALIEAIAMEEAADDLARAGLAGDLVATTGDVVATTGDVVANCALQTDLVATTEDIVAKIDDVVAKTDDLVATTEDVVATTDDLVATTEDVVATTEDIVATTEDLEATTEDIVFKTDAVVSSALQTDDVSCEKCEQRASELTEAQRLDVESSEEAEKGEMTAEVASHVPCTADGSVSPCWEYALVYPDSTLVYQRTHDSSNDKTERDADSKDVDGSSGAIVDSSAAAAVEEETSADCVAAVTPASCVPDVNCRPLEDSATAAPAPKLGIFSWLFTRKSSVAKPAESVEQKASQKITTLPARRESDKQGSEQKKEYRDPRYDDRLQSRSCQDQDSPVLLTGLASFLLDSVSITGNTRASAEDTSTSDSTSGTSRDHAVADNIGLPYQAVADNIGLPYQAVTDNIGLPDLAVTDNIDQAALSSQEDNKSEDGEAKMVSEECILIAAAALTTETSTTDRSTCEFSTTATILPTCEINTTDTVMPSVESGTTASVELTCDNGNTASVMSSGTTASVEPTCEINSTAPVMSSVESGITATILPTCDSGTSAPVMSRVDSGTTASVEPRPATDSVITDGLMPTTDSVIMDSTDSGRVTGHSIKPVSRRVESASVDDSSEAELMSDAAARFVTDMNIFEMILDTASRNDTVPAPEATQPSLVSDGGICLKDLNMDCWAKMNPSYLLDEKMFAAPSSSSATTTAVVVTKHSETNTCHSDFALLDLDTLMDLPVLAARSRGINVGVTNTNPRPIPSTLMLDKGCSTSPVDNEPGTHDFDFLLKLFPKIPREDLKEVFDKCQGEINWTVDLLLESGYVFEPSADLTVRFDNVDELHRTQSLLEELNSRDKSLIEREATAGFSVMEFNSEAASVPRAVSEASPTKRGGAKKQSKLTLQLQKQMEENFHFSDASYSENTLRIKKIRHGDNAKPDVKPDVATVTSEEGAAEEEQEEGTIPLTLDAEFVRHLQAMFGEVAFPGPEGASPVVELPVALARQIHGFLLEAQQKQLQLQETYFENMIKDEEFARRLQEAEMPAPDLRQIMDMEMALELYQADAASRRGAETKEDMATRLSMRKLQEMFPGVDPEMLASVFAAHDYSFAATLEVLEASTGEREPGVRTVMSPEALLELEKRLIDKAKQENRKQHDLMQETSAQESDGGVSAKDRALHDAQYYRDEANRLYQLRNECYQKANSAPRNGVRSYYAQVGHLYKERIDEANSLAASALLSANSHTQRSTTLDLHCLYVVEALEALDIFLDYHIACLSETADHKTQSLFIITGSGVHSAGGRPKIKPAVQRRLARRQLRFTEVNAGLLKVVVTRNGTLTKDTK